MTSFGWLVPVCVALAVYHVALNNFFTWDDFIWLDRARTFKNDWLQIFRIDVTYFDPLVHLMFLFDSAVGGLDARWYHCVDIALHAANSCLVYRFVRQLSGDARSALYAGALFAGSFAVADAVLWSSSRVDLLSTLFALEALILFLKYLRSDAKRDLLFALISYILALGSKGTPLVLPAILFWLIIQERKGLERAAALVPFVTVNVLYVLLLKVNSSQASMPMEKMHLNIRNLLYAFCDLLIPEGTLATLDLAATATVLFIVVTALAVISKHEKTRGELRRTGYCILVAALVPVLVTTEFRLLEKEGNPIALLLSPSHRIYLASAGAAIFAAGVLRFLEGVIARLSPTVATTAVVAILAGVISVDASVTRERDFVWEWNGKITRVAFEGLRAYRDEIGEGAQLGLISFPGSNGFLTPMAKVCLGRNDLTVLQKAQMGVIDEAETVARAERSYLFVLGNDLRIHDKSVKFREQLVLNRMALAFPERKDYAFMCNNAGKTLVAEITPLL
ncbi:glycosyltransferase family 39 protein [Geomonas sp. RF6]|uniref:ArnT family glycosyltransferase n=1 Tax=Geomonas sp. RF6 TaxID=2897342 RepID=UPI001E4C3710|nr:glycosyltransferase family 39 protein [Geomonas sp. RF6]UFS69801.1 glycosyltransferase family 39 protein [Geomonas sp. RF6]